MANPFLALGGIAVTVVTAAAGILTVPGWIADAQDAAAVNDLGNIRHVMANSASTKGSTHTIAAIDDEGGWSYGFELSDGVELTGFASHGHDWCVTAVSAAGHHFAVSSEVASIGEGSTRDTAARDASCAPTLIPVMCNPSIDREEGRVNRALNPSAELAVNRWVGARSTITRDTTRALYGDASFKITVTEVDAQNYVIATNSVASRLPVTGGEQLPMVASVYLEEANPYMGLQMYEYDADGDLLLPVLLSPLAPADAGRWTSLSHTFTLKPEAATVRPVIIGHQTMGLGAEWWLDGIAVGTDTYFDGDMLPGCFDPAVMRVRWAGAPHDSATILERR